MDPIEEEKSIKKQRKRTEDQNFIPSKMQINSLSQSSSQLSPSHKRMYNTIHNNHENSRQSGMFYNIFKHLQSKTKNGVQTDLEDGQTQSNFIKDSY